MRDLRPESAQVTGLAVVLVVALVGMAALVVDVGSWLRADRAAQSAADAAALAGAHALPEDPTAATSLSVDYADTNGGGLTAGDVQVRSDLVSNDTVHVEVKRQAPGIFARVLGFGDADVGASASARSGVPGAARWVAPVAVDYRHPLLAAAGCPCFARPTELDFEKVGPGAFRLINLVDDKGGVGPSDVGEWIQRGYDGLLPLAWYYSDPGFKPSSSHIKNALELRTGDELLFPVYRGTRAQGAGFEYEVIGWTGFHLTGFAIKGAKGAKLSGSFTRYIAEGVQSESDQPYYGARAIALVE